MDESEQEFFLHTKPAKMMVRLADPSAENYASALSSNIDCTYSHAVRIIQKLEEIGLIETRKKGRKKYIELTSRGQDVAHALNDLMKLLD
ncbi:winged helix DNA-binding protein [Candidatus Nanohaloarchaea archaeon]|nr:winged helix DNA-binding protein [Candidatus Nanohaloarchaea archaeon]